MAQDSAATINPSTELARLKAASEEQPTRDDLLSHYADALRQTGELNGALEAYARCTEIKPAAAEHWLNLGLMLRMVDRSRDSIPPLQKAVDIDPELLAARTTLARSFMDARMISHALKACHQIMSQAPMDAASHALAAEALRLGGEHQLARKHFEIACQLDPKNLEHKRSYAGTLLDLNEYEQARAAIDALVNADPSDPNARLLKLSLHRALSEHELGVACAQTLLDTHAQVPVVRIACAQTLLAAGQNEDVCTVLNPLTTIDALPAEHRKGIHFLLGDASDRMKQHDVAWSHFVRAHAMTDAKYDKTAATAQFEATAVAEPIDAVHNYATPTPAAPRPVFIVGMPRSGTSLVEQMLDLHPQIAGTGELGLLGRMVGRIPAHTGVDAAYPRTLDSLNKESTQSLAQWGLEQLKTVGGTADRYVEKTPTGFFYLGLAQMCFPDAVVLHCQRDPLDTCLSCYFHNFSGFHPYLCDLETLGFFYRLHERYMHMWSQRLSIPIISVRYESVTQNPEATLRTILDALELPWDDACLRVESNTRHVRTASIEQVRQPLHTKAIGRAQAYRQWLGPLQKALDENVINEESTARS